MQVVLCSLTISSPLQRLDIVLAQIREAGLKICKDKCDFASPSIKFLSHIVSSDGIRPDPEKVQVIQDYPTPSLVTEVRAFVGMASYYRRYVQAFADVVPLHEVTKGGNGQFVWTNEAEHVCKPWSSR